MLAKLVKFGDIEAMASHDKGELVSSDTARLIKEDVTSKSSQKTADDLTALLKEFKENFLVSKPDKESEGGKTAGLWRSRSLQTRQQQEEKRQSGNSRSGELAESPWPPTQRAARSGPISSVSRFQAPLHKPARQPQWQEIDGLYRRMRKILHASMYMDGDRLSPEDEMAVLDILKYHNQFEEKTGPGIDYIKIKQVYDEVTRCFWVVRVDGTEIDFSYHTCLKEKAAKECPDLLEYYDSLYRSYKPKRANIEPARRRVRDDTMHNGVNSF